MSAPIISTADAKAHCRIFHSQDDAYLATLITAVVAEWERVTHYALAEDTTERPQYYEDAPEDGQFRVWVRPVDVTSVTWIADGAAIPTPLPEEHWRSLDGYSVYDATTLISDDTLTFPGTLTYSTLLATSGTVPADIIQALKMRVAYYYAYRGDDVQPPDTDGWLMLAARHRTGAVL